MAEVNAFHRECCDKLGISTHDRPLNFDELVESMKRETLSAFSVMCQFRAVENQTGVNMGYAQFKEWLSLLSTATTIQQRIKPGFELQ